MKKFVFMLSDNRGFRFMLCADVKEEEVESIKKKITEKLVIKGTVSYLLGDGRYTSTKNPKIIEQLKNITGYEFVGFKPDLYLSFSSEYLNLPGHV